MYKHQLGAQHEHLGAVLQHHDPHEQHVRVPIRGALCARTAANRTFGHTTPALASSTTPSRSTLGVPSPCSAPRPDTSRWARSAAPWSGSQMSQREEQDSATLGEQPARSRGHHRPHCRCNRQRDVLVIILGIDVGVSGVGGVLVGVRVATAPANILASVRPKSRLAHVWVYSS